MSMPTTYAVYLLVSIALTVWVARTLHRRGRIFLVETFHGHEKLADSVNDLLVVGFYLINFGYVALALRFGHKPENLQEAIEFLATKIGLVLIILGGMHFFNLLVFAKLRQSNQAKPPIRRSNAPQTDFGQMSRAVKSRF